MSTLGSASADRDAVMVDFGRRAVARWAGFPADDDPRRLVLLLGPVRVDGGFATGDAKRAFMDGAIECDESVPEEAVAPLRVPEILMGGPPGVPLRVVAAVPSTADFATDRGPERLGAWRVEALDARGPIWVLSRDVLARCWSRPPNSGAQRAGPAMLRTATVSPDGVQLLVRFTGGSEDLFRYHAEVVESVSAVCVVPLERPTRELRAGAFITAVGHRRQLAVTLTQPLGGRVLLNLDGSPIEVTASSTRTITAPM